MTIECERGRCSPPRRQPRLSAPINVRDNQYVHNVVNMTNFVNINAGDGTHLPESRARLLPRADCDVTVT